MLNLFGNNYLSYKIKSKNPIMKKNLLTFILMLCIGIFSAKTYAQDIPGGGGDGIGSDIGIDGGSTAPVMPVIINPPSYVSNLKRNNGNGTTVLGSAEARLAFSDKSNHPVVLLAITDLQGNVLPKGSVVLDPNGEFNSKGYVSYALKQNIPPVGKLLFHFSCGNNSFCIPLL